MSTATLAIVFGGIGFGFGLSGMICGLIAIIRLDSLKREFDMSKN